MRGENLAGRGLEKRMDGEPPGDYRADRRREADGGENSQELQRISGSELSKSPDNWTSFESLRDPADRAI